MFGLRRPILSAAARNVHSQFQPTPNPNFVECATQVILDDLLAGSDNLADFAISEALPNQNCDLDLLRGEAFAWGHDCAPSLVNMAMASFTRLRPSRIPARKNRVRK